jgi:hypothetical protein
MTSKNHHPGPEAVVADPDTPLKAKDKLDTVSLTWRTVVVMVFYVGYGLTCDCPGPLRISCVPNSQMFDALAESLRTPRCIQDKPSATNAG